MREFPCCQVSVPAQSILAGWMSWLLSKSVKARAKRRTASYTSADSVWKEIKCQWRQNWHGCCGKMHIGRKIMVPQKRWMDTWIAEPHSFSSVSAERKNYDSNFQASYHTHGRQKRPKQGFLCLQSVCFCGRTAADRGQWRRPLGGHFK